MLFTYSHPTTCISYISSLDNDNDVCSYYQNTVAGIDRIVGAAGMFSTGTNLVTQLLKRNCYIPERYNKYGNSKNKELLGIRWQVRKCNNVN